VYIHPVQIIILLILAVVVLAGGMIHLRRREKLTALAAAGGDHEARQIKERLQVLERIATDKGNSLAREIEELRDR
jgi:hypothetical protein